MVAMYFSAKFSVDMFLKPRMALFQESEFNGGMFVHIASARLTDSIKFNIILIIMKED